MSTTTTISLLDMMLGNIPAGDWTIERNEEAERAHAEAVKAERAAEQARAAADRRIALAFGLDDEEAGTYVANARVARRRGRPVPSIAAAVRMTEASRALYR